MSAFPTQLKAFTNRAAGTARWSRSMSESLGPVKKGRMPFTGGPEMGLVASTTTLPPSCRATPLTASSATAPATASTTTSACPATSVNVPSGMPLSLLHSASFLPSRLPMRTSCPCSLSPRASALPTSPDPITPYLAMGASC